MHKTIASYLARLRNAGWTVTLSSTAKLGAIAIELYSITRLSDGRELRVWDAEPDVALRNAVELAEALGAYQRCPGCGQPAHAGESDDDHYHADCRPIGA